MKKIVMIFAAMAAVLSSCQKSELEPVSTNDGKNIFLNISVSNPGADTKALIKTAWAEGDSISIWFDTNTGANPDLVIKYDADNTKWIQKIGATVSGNNPSTGTGKYAKAIYNGTVKVASKDEYTYENSTLTFSIENWTFLTEVQVVVKGLTSADAVNYTLACDKFTPLASTGNSYTVGTENITASAGTKGNAVTGISNTDGVAFVFATADYSTSSEDKQDFSFTLKNIAKGSEITKAYTPNVAIVAKTDKLSIKALTIESSSFATDVDYVVMKMGSDQSGELKWAKYNIGASTVAGSYLTCYGGLYQWGSVETLYTGFPWTGAMTGDFTGKWKSGKENGFAVSNAPYYSSGEYTKYTKDFRDVGDGKDVLDADDDVATQYLGTGWRMPTKQEFQDLLDACIDDEYDFVTDPAGESASVERGVYWCSSYDGVAGCLFCDGTNRLFFPAAGTADGNELENEFYGEYWSKTLDEWGAERACLLYFDEFSVECSTGIRSGGLTVRPVSD